MKLIDFLRLYNFRQYEKDREIESDRYDTQVIRIYLDNHIGTNNYVEFGVFDFGEDDEDIFGKFINAKILEKTVAHYYYNYDIEIFCIYLESEDEK